MSVSDYINKLDAQDQLAIQSIRKAIKDHLPKGFEECMSYGMISYVVPHATYPKGYHCKPEQPLPFVSIASQKNHYAIYHMGIYADAQLFEWFTQEYAKTDPKKMDIGKSCIRFKKNTVIPIDLLEKLATKVTPAEWIERYERLIAKKN
jgi:uncharacterized protein YdhG (YjbR/CyaY superfamily)